jgi:hypothetical protein
MRQYTIFHAPVMSFFSRNFYRDVGLNWNGTGLAYLLLLLIICSVPYIVKVHLEVNNFIKSNAPAIIYQIPPIKIIKGEASTAEAETYRIISPDNKKVIAIIDTTGQTTSLEGTDAKVLLTKTDLIYKHSDVETRTFNLKTVDNFSIDLKKIVIWLGLFDNYFAILLFPFLVMGFFIYRALQLLIYGVIGLLFAKLCKADLTYKTLYRLAVMAVTPAIIVNTIFQTAGITFPMYGLVFFLIAMIYLFVAVKTVSSTDKDTDSNKDTHSSNEETYIDNDSFDPV